VHDQTTVTECPRPPGPQGQRTLMRDSGPDHLHGMRLAEGMMPCTASVYEKSDGSITDGSWRGGGKRRRVGSLRCWRRAPPTPAINLSAVAASRPIPAGVAAHSIPSGLLSVLALTSRLKPEGRRPKWPPLRASKRGANASFPQTQLPPSAFVAPYDHGAGRANPEDDISPRP